ncbi:uncharacterized protein J8A68_004566 [[Candida] subhashii]|uniref:F-box domain-containing protein n=1 Tax=[Candida] subhashii TaxID=561895 RepID=A0A8J5QH28_9ASCO|nr:uncharacterized protein J8A68_004566 [[Candida] subhashii]KAG7661963.1 hypothetical protein J8A68_004566 [[Candida] subhashii]
MSNQSNLQPNSPGELLLASLPDDVLLDILYYLNQIDTISLSLTCLRFKEVTRARLYSRIYVYRGSKLIPRSYYVKNYTDFTQISWHTFSRMLEDKECLASCKMVYFVNDDVLDVPLLDRISDKFRECMIVIERIRKSEVQRWILRQPDSPLISIHCISSPTTKVDPVRLYIKNLTISISSEMNLPYELSKYPNLAYLFIEKLQNLQGLPQISVTGLRISELREFNIDDFCGCFDISRLTSLDLSNVSQEIIPMAPRFKSLRKLYISNYPQIMSEFAEALPQNSLVHLTIPPSMIPSFLPVALRHSLSLRCITSRSRASFIVPGDSSQVRKLFHQFESHLDMFPKIQYVIWKHVALQVTRDVTGNALGFAPVDFHPLYFPY